MREVRGAGRRAVGRSPGRAPGPSALDTCTAQQVRRVRQDTCPDRRSRVFDGRRGRSPSGARRPMGAGDQKGRSAVAGVRLTRSSWGPLHPRVRPRRCWRRIAWLSGLFLEVLQRPLPREDCNRE